MKKQKLRVAIAQINCVVGDLNGNSEKICRFVKDAKRIGADIVAFPELAITGYPPEDLLIKPKFIKDNIKALKRAADCVDENIVAIIGFVDAKADKIYNAAAVIYKKRIVGIYHKMLLPNYGVFDEQRYFKTGSDLVMFRFGDIIFGVDVCEDIWHKEGPARLQAACGAGLIININSSPYYAGKVKVRENILKAQAKANNVSIVYANLVGGQDELVFDGQSMIVANSGKVLNRGSAFTEDLIVTDLDVLVKKAKPRIRLIKIADKFVPTEKPALNMRRVTAPGPVEEIYQALMLGLKDYVNKNGFKKVAIGISGGIDSGLVAVLAVDALGKENVCGVFMPSRYSSLDSREDSELLAQNLGIKLMNISIEDVYKIYLEALKPCFAGAEENIAEENLQARIRGNMLMALSNKFGWLILTTGNKSEMSTGYATLYGDMAGGFAVIKDVPKTLVYKLAKYRNIKGIVIPERMITKEPTAELKHNQKDSDSLPVYEILDPVLKAYVELDKDLNSIVSMGFDKQTVAKVLSLVDKSEYKRRQSPPGIKITPKAFGKDRRMPITNKYINSSS